MPHLILRRSVWVDVRTKVKSWAQKGRTNDWPGALGGENCFRAERQSAPTRLVVPTTMSNDNPAAHKSRQDRDEMATIKRADDAWHDVAQLHLFEFGGERL